MKRLLASSLAICLVATSGLASAQSYRSNPYFGQPQDHGQQATARYDYARVLRVDPVLDNRYGRAYTTGQRCYERQTYVRGDDYYGNYRGDGYRGDGYYTDGYRAGDRYGNGYHGDYGRGGGTRAGATVATIVGGIVGAAIGSQVGGGSARYATSALGTMVGGMAGREIYERRTRVPDRVGTVTVCDPEPVNAGYGTYDTRYPQERAVSAYDVTYEYAGQQYTTRTSYHPGDRIRVRVDVRPE